MNDEERQAIEARLHAACAMVSALCKPRYTEGSREWIMSIPARHDYDPDLVIGAALSDMNALLQENAELRAQVQNWQSVENTIASLETKINEVRAAGQRYLTEEKDEARYTACNNRWIGLSMAIRIIRSQLSAPCKPRYTEGSNSELRAQLEKYRRVLDLASSPQVDITENSHYENLDTGESTHM